MVDHNAKANPDDSRRSSATQDFNGLSALQEHELALLGHDIHDGFIQDVVAAKMLLEAANSQLPEGMKGLQEQLRHVTQLLGHSVDEARRMIAKLQPVALESFGLIVAIQQLVEDCRHQLGGEVTASLADSLPSLSPGLDTSLYRIAQEALANVAKHSRANTVQVQIGEREDQVVLEIVDDGVGFDTDDVPADRFGVRGIVRRAEIFGGSAEIQSAPGKGTRILVRVPADGDLTD